MVEEKAILERSEVRTRSIYAGWYAEKDRLTEILTSGQYDESARCTAILAALACKATFPLTLGQMRVIIGADYWYQNCTINYVKAVSGKQFLYWNHSEWFYVLLPSKHTTTRAYGVSFVADGRLLSGQPGMTGTMLMPLETSISRFTLSHPFLESELHEPGRILLSKG